MRNGDDLSTAERRAKLGLSGKRQSHQCITGRRRVEEGNGKGSKIGDEAKHRWPEGINLWRADGLCLNLGK